MAPRAVARRGAAPPRVDPLLGAGPSGSGRRDPPRAEDERFVQVLLCGGADRPYGEPRYLPIFEAAAASRAPGRDPLRRRGDGHRRAPGGAGPVTFYIEWHTLGSACSTMAHLVSLLCHGTFERFLTLTGAAHRGRYRLAPGDSLAARHELASALARGALARAQAERGRPRARPLLDPAARAHRWARRPPLRDARGRRCARQRSASPPTTRTGTSTTPASCSSGCRRLARPRPARERGRCTASGLAPHGPEFPLGMGGRVPSRLLLGRRGAVFVARS